MVTLFNFRRNIDDEKSEEYFKTCLYSQSNDRYCPIFSLRQIVQMAGKDINFTALSTKVSPIPIPWISCTMYKLVSILVQNLREVLLGWRLSGTVIWTGPLVGKSVTQSIQLRGREYLSSNKLIFHCNIIILIITFYAYIGWMTPLSKSPKDSILGHFLAGII